MAEVVSMTAERTPDGAGRPFSGGALALAIIASARSQPLSEPALDLPDGARPCDLATLEREFAAAVHALSDWIARQDRALAAAPLGSPLKISVGVVRAAVATLDGVIRACRDRRAAGHGTLVIDFGAVRALVNERPGLLAQTVAAALRASAKTDVTDRTAAGAPYGTLRAIA